MKAVGATRGSGIAIYVLLLFVVSVWGGSFVAARMLLYPSDTGSITLTPTALATVRFSLASAVFLPILVLRQRRKPTVKLSDLPLFLFLGQLGISAYFWLQYTGVQLTNAGISAVLVVGVIPLATMVVSRFALHEPLGGRRILALAVGAIGVVVVGAQRGLQVAIESGFLFGTLCLVADAIAFAVYSALIRGIRDRFDSLTVTGGMMVAGTAGLLALSLVEGGLGGVASLTLLQWLAIAYLSFVCSVLAYFFYNYALAQIEAARAAVWIYLEPPIAVALGWALLGEAVAPATIAGAALIVISLVLAHRT